MGDHPFEANIFSPVIHRYSLAFNEIDSKEPNILDVGGYKSRKHIGEEYFNNFLYTSLNVGYAWYKDVEVDYLYDGITIPFENDSFEYVISVDSLEHIIFEQRLQVLCEIVRVAKKRAIVVTPFRIPHVKTDESYILEICEKYGVLSPPSLNEHELYGLPFLSEIEEYVAQLGGVYKFATNKKDYWSLQTTMLWNTISLKGDSISINRKIQEFQEGHLKKQPYPTSAENSYRCVLIFDKKENKA